MQARKIIDKFQTKDSGAIREATWEILRSNNREVFAELKDYLPKFREILASVDMGGMLHRNAKDTELAFGYIEDTCNGVCRCRLYIGQNFFDPEKEAVCGFLDIVKSEVKVSLYERHFTARCQGCSKLLQVREVHGWHVPWAEWGDA